jgi:hypothetical protein
VELAVDALCAPHSSNKEINMTFRVQIDNLSLVCRSQQWGDFDIVDYPAELSRFVEGLRETCGWKYAGETPFHILWDKIVPEDKPQLVPHVIHGIAVVSHGADKLWELIKDLPLSELDLNALYLAAVCGGKDTERLRAWLGGIEFPPRKELVASLLTTPLYVGVAVACATCQDIPITARITHEVAKAILRELPNKYWTAQKWLQLVVNSGYADLLADYEKDAELHPFIEEFYARDAAKAWDIFRVSEDENARAVALNTIVRSGHPNAADAVREALHDSSALVREAAFDNLQVLPRKEHAKWLVHFAYHGIPGDYGETRKRAWYKIEQTIPEEEFAEFLAQKLR